MSRDHMSNFYLITRFLNHHIVFHNPEVVIVRDRIKNSERWLFFSPVISILDFNM